MRLRLQAGISGEVPLAVAADDTSGACSARAGLLESDAKTIGEAVDHKRGRHWRWLGPGSWDVFGSGTTMNWRGRTVEYSSDPARHPLVEVPGNDSGRFLRPLPGL
jgi:hypothetical protein